jgi:hypothetical protein
MKDGQWGQAGWWAALVMTLGTACVGRLAAQGEVNARRAAAPDALIRIYNVRGTLRITGWARDTVAVSGYVDPSLGRFFIGGTADGMKLGVEAPDSTSTGTAVLDVSVPAGARLSIKTASAGVELDAVTGPVDIFTVSGQVRVGGKPASVAAESMDGNIELAMESPWAEVRTASGVVVLRGVIQNATVSSISGPLYIGMEGKIARASFETVSGEIAFKGDLDPEGVLEAESHSGNIELRLPEHLGATYSLTAYSGELHTEFETVTARPQKGEWRFAVGDGRAQVTVRTFKGRVDLKKRFEPGQ